MKTLGFLVTGALTTIVAVSPALAISRYVSTSMSCDRVQATIVGEGAVIMRYRSTRNPGLPLYGRYVVDGRFCSAGEYAKTEFIPAADTRFCPVYECKAIEFDDDDWFRRHR